MIDENTSLKQRVADLERAKERLQQDNDALKSKVERFEQEATTAKMGAQAEALGAAPGKKLTATLQTSMGDIHCTLRMDQAPETVTNFVQLAKGEKQWTDAKSGKKTTRPLYDGTVFHRVIPQFMIQGGDPAGNGTGGPGYQFADEVSSGATFDKPGLLAMANRGPNTNGSQFFITEGTPTHLNGKHTIFGDCTDLELVRKIARVDRSERDVPKTPVVIKHIAIASE
jgi:peptidyl-prolyl cis-trans isomerase A (cyclophilin A)